MGESTPPAAASKSPPNRACTEDTCKGSPQKELTFDYPWERMMYDLATKDMTAAERKAYDEALRLKKCLGKLTKADLYQELVRRYGGSGTVLSVPCDAKSANKNRVHTVSGERCTCNCPGDDIYGVWVPSGKR